MERDLSSRSIAELEGIEWKAPESGAPLILVRCYRLRMKPLSQLSSSDMRALIGQDVGLDFVMPLALNAVEDSPLLETEHYRGDLLVAILRAEPSFYRRRPEFRSRVEKILESVPSALEELDHIEFDISSEALEEGISSFRSGNNKA